MVSRYKALFAGYESTRGWGKGEEITYTAEKKNKGIYAKRLSVVIFRLWDCDFFLTSWYFFSFSVFLKNVA